MRKTENGLNDNPVIGGWTERSLTDKERAAAAAAEAWCLVNAGLADGGVRVWRAA